jgi:hypothetical protein
MAFPKIKWTLPAIIILVGLIVLAGVGIAVAVNYFYTIDESNTVPITVNPSPTPPPTEVHVSVTLTASATTITYGTPITLTATVTDANVVGRTLHFYGPLDLGSAQIMNVGGVYKATLTLSNLSVGVHSITAADPNQ